MTAALIYNHQSGEYDVEVKERVLVFPAERIANFLSDAPSGILTDPNKVAEYLRLTLYSGKCFYMDREKAEKDPSFKQVIPYVVFRRPDHEIFAYQRTKKSGEVRLRGNWSIGIGGHINPEDERRDCVTTVEELQRRAELAYWEAFYREIREETGYMLRASPKTEAPIVALIYDESDEVGRVHFGVVHIFSVPAGTEFVSNDPSISEGRWFDAVTLMGLTKPDGMFLENWSNLVLDHV